MIHYILIPEDRIKLLRKDERWRKELEKFVKVNIELNKEIKIEGEDSLAVLKVKEIMRAFGRGFDFKAALNLLDEDYKLETIEIKDFSGKSKNRQIILKGRVIGRGGEAKKRIENATNAKIAIYGKTISIIGRWDEVALAKEAIEMLLSGSKHNTVYQFLEKRKL